MGTIKREKREKAFKYGVMLTVFILGAALYFFWGRKTLTWYHSDSAFHVIAGKDIMSGNVLLKDWYGSTQTLYTLNVLYGLLGAVFGYSFDLVLVVSAFLWACFLALIAAVILWYYQGKPMQCIMRICLVFTLCSSACFIWQRYGIFGGVHFDFVLIGFFYAWVISKEIETCNKESAILSVTASVLLFFSIWSDKLATLLVVVPILAVLAFELLFCGGDAKQKICIVKWLIFTVVLFVTAKGSVLFLQNAGMMITDTSVNGTTVPEYSELFPNMAFCLKSILYLFGCDFFGQHIGAESVLLLLRFIFLVVMFVSLLFSLKTIWRRTFNRILLFSIAAAVLVSVFTEEGAGSAGNPEWTSRLLICLFFSLVLLFSQIDWECVVALIKINVDRKGWHALGVTVMLLLLGLNLHELRNYSPLKADVPSLEVLVPVGDTLVNRGLTRGFGTYWLSSGVTLASDFQVDVRPVVGENLSTFQWLSKSTMDWDYANFVLLDKSGGEGVTEESVVGFIGTPTEKISVDDVTILVWDKNVLPYIEETANGWWILDADQTEKTIETTNRYFYSQFVANEDGYFTSDTAGQLLFGPYRPMGEGTYSITFEYDYEGTLEPGTVLGQVDINSNAQKVEFVSQPAIAGTNSVRLENVHVLPGCADFETRFYANVEGITVREIVIERIGM